MNYSGLEAMSPLGQGGELWVGFGRKDSQVKHHREYIWIHGKLRKPQSDLMYDSCRGWVSSKKLPTSPAVVCDGGLISMCTPRRKRTRQELQEEEYRAMQFRVQFSLQRGRVQVTLGMISALALVLNRIHLWGLNLDIISSLLAFPQHINKMQ